MKVASGKFGESEGRDSLTRIYLAGSGIDLAYPLVGVSTIEGTGGCRSTSKMTKTKACKEIALCHFL